MKFSHVLSIAIAWLMLLPLATVHGQAATEQAPATQTDLPSVDQVLAKYFDAIGGKDKYAGVKSLTAKGTMSIPEQGVTGNFTIQQTAPDRMRMQMTIEGIGEQFFGYDGETAWQNSALTGPEILEGEQAEQFAMQADVAPFIDLDEKFDSVEVTGKKDFQGHSAYSLVAKREGREPITHYFAVDSGLHIGTEMTQVSQMGKMEVMVMVEDYRDVNGLKISHKSTVELPVGMSIVTQVESIDNSELPESTFELPDEIKELKK